MKATAKDLRFHSKELLDTVRRGEEVLITYRGKPCAKLVPVDEDVVQSDKESPQLFGIWADHDQVDSVQDFINKARDSRS